LVLGVLEVLMLAHHKAVRQEQTLYFHLSLLRAVAMVLVLALLLVAQVVLVVVVKKVALLVLELLDKDLMVALA
jgi:hypothetical protein